MLKDFFADLSNKTTAFADLYDSEQAKNYRFELDSLSKVMAETNHKLMLLKAEYDKILAAYDEMMKGANND